MIPLADPRRVDPDVAAEIERRVHAVLDHARFVGGPEVADFEDRFATWCGVAHAIGVANGTDAIRLGLQAAGVGPGDEVLVPDLTMIASAEAVCSLGAVPVLVEATERTYGLDAEAAADAVSERTRAVVPVHLFGIPCPIPPLPERVAVVEDACQAHGAALDGRRAGGLGRAGAFSFFPSKNLGGAGDGGAVTTDDAEIADRVRRLRDHGRVAKYEHAESGWNSRLDSIQAAVLLAKLPGLDAENERRRLIAAAYDDAFAGLPLDLPAVPPGGQAVYHLYVVATDARDHLSRMLAELGVQTAVHYDRPLHRQPALAGRAVAPRRPEATERICRRVLSLPCFAGLTDTEVETVIDAVRKALNRNATRG